MGSNISVQIQDALQQSSSEAIIRDVKHAVARELQALDPRVAIKSTDYFNHTFVPDFVLGWGSGNEQEARDVYLRFDINSPAVWRDLESLNAESPAFIGISGDAKERARTADVAGVFDNCLVSSTAALEPISSERARTPITQMVKTSLLQGGRGYLVGSAAMRMSQVVSHADEGVATLSQPTVAAVINSLSSSFTPPFFSRMQKVMKVLWASRGGDADDFPGEGRGGALSTGELSEILPFILKLDEIRNTSFWRELGENLSLHVLENLEHVEAGCNLNYLVNVNLDRVKAKSMALDRSELTLFDDEEDPLHWEIADSTLILGSPEFALRFVNDRRKISRRNRDLGRAPRWAEIEDRINRFSAEGIEFTAPTSKLRIQSSTAAGLTDSTDMNALNSALGDLARVNSIQLRVPHSREMLEINFDRSVVDSIEAPIGPHLLARYGLDLLYQASDEVLEYLKEFVSQADELPWWRGSEDETDQ
ncbi:hypothetical protein ACWGJB_26370 [Streptomyces sp. NPDC054813]